MQQIMHAGIFAGYKDILMASAIIGYNLKAYVPIKKAASDGVLMSFFNEKDYDIMDLIAYSYTKEQSIVKKDEKYEIFSSFANLAASSFSALILSFSAYSWYNTLWIFRI